METAVKMRILETVFVIGLLASAQATTDDGTGQADKTVSTSTADTVNDRLIASANATTHDKSEKGENAESTPTTDLTAAREKFLFGSFSTTSYTQVIATTSTVFFSCLSGSTSQVVCQGRAARRSKKMKEITVNQGNSNSALEGTLPEEVIGHVDNSQEGKSDGRLGFTIWTTTRTTTSVTVYFTNTSTTLRLSYYCYAGGIKYPEFNCRMGG